MLNTFKFILIVSLSICVASCGNTESNGLGTTVKVTASIKSSSSISTSFGVGVPGNFGFGKLSYNIQSTALPYIVGIVASPVMITTAKISYLPLLDSANNLSPALPSFTKAVGINVSAGSSGGVDDMQITSSTVLQYLYDNFVGSTSGLLNVPGMQFNYVVIVEFSGYETNSGQSLTCDQVVGNMYVFK